MCIRDRRKVLETLEKFGIAHLKDRRFSSLSGGQRQRVLLARSFAQEKKLLILDEPLAGLDPEAQDDLYEMLEKINESGTAIIMVSHDSQRAVKYANKVIKLDGRRVIYEEGGKMNGINQ